MKLKKQNKVIIKANFSMKPEDLNRVVEGISNDLEDKGFVVLDNRFDIYIISTEAECDG